MPSCQAYDKAFRDSEQQISKDLIKKKLKLNRNAYWGRVRDAGPFPENSGTRIKKIRLSRIGFGNMEFGWRTVQDNGCLSNVCSQPDADTLTHGSTESFYSLETARIVTDPICLAHLPFRQIPVAELMHIESQLQNIAQYFWDDWLRTRFTDMCEHKQIAFVSSSFKNDTDQCKVFEKQCNPDIESDNGFIMWRRDPKNNPTLTNLGYPLDERYISVNCALARIDDIAMLSGDWLENAIASMQYEDENMPFLDEGVELYDLVVPDLRVVRSLDNLERRQGSECLPAVVYKEENLTLKYGIKRVIRDMIGVRWDKHALKYYPDYEYNSTLGTYSTTDPTTWPRFKRVFPYIKRQNPNQTVDMVPNIYYQRAPFGIANYFSPKVFEMRGHPSAESIGSAKLGEYSRSYGGEARWRNEYDKVCNRDYETGNWELNFGAGAEPMYPEYGNSFFHRIDASMRLAGAKCPTMLLGCNIADYGTDCYNSVQAGETGIVAGVTRGANVARQDNYKYYI